MMLNSSTQGGPPKLSTDSTTADFEKNDDDVVITGLGVVSPIGIGKDAVWQSLQEKKTGVSLRPEWANSPLSLAATVADSFDPRQYIKPRKSLKVMCREIQLGVAAAGLAVDDAAIDLDALDPFRIGVVLGTDIMHCPPGELAEAYHSCLVDGIFDFKLWFEQAQRKLNPLFMLKYLPNMAASHVAIAQNAQGPCNTLVMGEISGLLSVMEAADVVASGRADVMLAGGSGCGVNLTTIVFHGTERLAQTETEPVLHPAPFDLNREGTVVGEGAGVLVLERRDAATQRGARIYGSVAGYSRGMTRPSKNRRVEGQSFALKDALKRGRLEVKDLDHVNATGHASEIADQNEAIAIQNVLGDCPVVAPSSYFGTLSAASSAVQLLTSLVAAEQGVRPATLNYATPDEYCPVRVSTEVEAIQNPAFVKLASTHTGQTAAMAIRLENQLR